MHRCCVRGRDCGRKRVDEYRGGGRRSGGGEVRDGGGSTWLFPGMAFPGSVRSSRSGRRGIGIGWSGTGSSRDSVVKFSGRDERRRGGGGGGGGMRRSRVGGG